MYLPREQPFARLNPLSAAAMDRRASIEAWKEIGTRALFFGLVMGIFALRFKFLLLLALGAAAVVFGSLSIVRPIHRIAMVVLLNFGYWLASGAISGGLGWSSFSSGEFWRGEGRCFFFYLPLLAISILEIRQSQLRFLVRMVAWLTLLGIILCVMWLLGLGDMFQAEEDAETGEFVPSTYFVGLMTSHTGAGAFWATVTSFLLAYSIRAADRPMQLLAVAAGILTLGTGGRAATLGLLAAVGWLALSGDLLKARMLKIIGPAAATIVAGAWIIAALVPQVSERMLEMFSARTFSSLVGSLDEPTLREASGFFYSGAGVEHHNLVIRLFLWKYAIWLFQQSPLVGVGFCRFNDTYLELDGVPHVAMLASGGQRYLGSGICWEQEQLMTSTGNAHNSYLHMLAETGTMGFVLFLYLWYLLYRECRVDPGERTSGGRFDMAYCHGCRAMVVSLLVTALAGHALAAPSGGIVLTVFIGAWLAYERKLRYTQVAQLAPGCYPRSDG